MNHRILFFGSSDFGLLTIERLKAQSGADIVGVVSQPARPTGRVGPGTTPVSRWAESRNVSLITPETLRSDSVVARIRDFKADTFLVAAYGLIMPQSILNIPRYGCLNIHASLLPRYRGAAPVPATIINDDTTTGVTLMLMDAGVDTGPIIGQWSTEVYPDDTTPRILSRLSELAAVRVPARLTEWWLGKIKARPQSGVFSSSPKLTVADGRADWQSAVKIERQVRAFQPWPGVWTEWRNRRIKILSAAAASGQFRNRPGTIVAHPDKPGWAIVCAEGLLRPFIINFDGRRPVAAASVIGSYPGWLGSVLV